MLVDTGKYPPVIKSHSIYKGTQPCGSLVLQLLKMGVIVGEKKTLKLKNISKMFNFFIVLKKWRYLKF